MAKNSTWKASLNTANNAITGLGRWATTDHTDASKLQANLPLMGWIDTLSMILVSALCALLGAVASAALVGLLLTYGVSMLLTF